MNSLGDDAPYQPSPAEATAAAAASGTTFVAGERTAGPPSDELAGDLSVSRASSEEWRQVVEWAADGELEPGPGRYGPASMPPTLRASSSGVWTAGPSRRSPS